MPVFITLAVEGPADASVAKKLVGHVGLSAGSVYVAQGKGYLDRRLHGYNHAARLALWLVLRDLDHDADCAPELALRLLPEPAAAMCLRIAVRQSNPGCWRIVRRWQAS